MPKFVMVHSDMLLADLLMQCMLHLADACIGPTRWVCRRFSSNVEDGASQSVQVYCVSLNSFTQYVYKASQDFPTPVGRIPHL